MQNQTIFELYTDDNKPKYFGSPKDILKSAKKKNLMKTLIFVRLKYLKMKS